MNSITFFPKKVEVGPEMDMSHGRFLKADEQE